ncbi:S-layer homology domain-containing protein [Sporosarcina aquimarina]|uniref:S-layer homology domain-containing protein n=1 Tax=Sporosarcina aquimarina TaxID=114975 RepID=A0ABU4FW30_9BACL|nr:S-layer homology domain-containing protein [Sporosarcina aquimarina]MDW0108866.1 S-layer homology domain-containing protein [Sporosarcina aquimarina]
MKKTTNYSKFVATAATATLVASAVVPAVSAKEMKFSDVSKRYTEAVDYLVNKEITKGISDSKYGTDMNIKRIDVAMMIARATLTQEEIDNAPKNTFGDVPTRAAKQISALKKKGILDGKTTTSFGSEASITRGEAAIMLSRAYGIEGDTANVAFSDVAPRYKDAVAALVDNKITEGKSATKFATTDSIKRGELALFLFRLETLDATPAPEYKVDSLEAINGTQVQVKFTDTVDPVSLFKDGKMGAFKDGVFTMSKVGSSTPEAGALKGMLSKDGKTLTVTTENVVKGDYTVVINNLKAKDGKEIEKFTQVANIKADATAPKVVTADKVNSSQYLVKFSEPMKTLGTVTYKKEDGSAVEEDLAPDFKEGDSEVLIKLPTDLEAGKSLKVQMVAAKDMSGNLISPNPAEVTLTKGQPDGVAPAIETIEQTGANQFTVKFSEALSSNPVVTIGGVAAKSVEVNPENPLEYVVTTEGNLTTAQTVVVKDFEDLSGQAGTTYSKVVTFTEDTEAPVVTSTNVVADSEDKQQYVEFTFDKNVNLEDATMAASGKYVKDYVTKAGLEFAATPVAYKSEDDHKVVRVPVKTLLTGNDVEGAAYELTYKLEGIKSVANKDLKEKTGQLKFTRAADGKPENTNVVTVEKPVLDVSDNNKLIVTFDQAVDGASAVNKENYTIDGATIKDVTLLPVAESGKQQAVLNLTPGSSTFNGERAMTIKNIKALGSTKTMDTWSGTVNLKENIAPTVETAKLTDTKEITLTFTEAVNGAAANDFEVLVEGQSMATPLKVNAAVENGTKKAIIKLDAAITTEQINKGITLKPVETMDIKDVNGNMLSVPANITVTR